MKRFIKSAIACIAAVAMIATVAPVTTYAASQKTVTVTNQKQLEAAIKNGATKITIKTAKNVKITIPASKKAAKVEFVVNAKNATVTNKASVKSLTVKDAKAFTESGKNNDIKIATDKKLTVTVAKSAKGADIQVAAEGADVKIVANGEVSSVAVAKSDANVVIKGTSDNKIDVTVSKPGSRVSTSVPVAVTADRKTTLVIGKGADGSTVTANASIKVAVAKETTVASVEVTAASAKVDLVAKGTVSDVKIAESATGANLSITGTTKDVVKVTVDAKDTTVKADTPVDTTLNADAKVDLGAGAEGSKVTQGSADVKVDVSNGTTDKVTITDSTGKDTTVDAGKDQTTADTGKTEDNKNNSNSGSSSSSGGSAPSPSPAPTPTPDPTEAYVDSAKVFVKFPDKEDLAEIKNGVVVKDTAKGKEIERTLTQIKGFIKQICKTCSSMDIGSPNAKKFTVDKKVVTVTRNEDGAGGPVYFVTYGDYSTLVCIDQKTKNQREDYITIMPNGTLDIQIK